MSSEIEVSITGAQDAAPNFEPQNETDEPEDPVLRLARWTLFLANNASQGLGLPDQKMTPEDLARNPNLLRAYL